MSFKEVYKLLCDKFAEQHWTEENVDLYNKFASFFGSMPQVEDWPEIHAETPEEKQEREREWDFFELVSDDE